MDEEEDADNDDDEVNDGIYYEELSSIKKKLFIYKNFI